MKSSNTKMHLHIVGLGLIGGSVASGLTGANFHISGSDLDQEREQKALEREYVSDIISINQLPDSVDGVLLAVPVPEMPAVVETIMENHGTPRFFTDVGSTKNWICSQIKSILPESVEFIGAHPMAGSEQSGLEASDPILFENAICVLTPEDHSYEHLGSVKNVWNTLGAHIIEMPPATHDRCVSFVSHLPHLNAAALLHSIRSVESYDDRLLPLAAGGFRDTTRVATGDPRLWKDIFETNRMQVLETIQTFLDVLEDIKNQLEAKDWNSLEKWLKEAKEIRASIPEKTKGIIGSLFELRLLAPDRPGILAEITQLLGEESINITDIEVLRVREGEMGTIRLGFRRKHELKKAREILSEKGERIKII